MEGMSSGTLAVSSDLAPESYFRCRRCECDFSLSVEWPPMRVEQF
jgi:hypothetical protein